jgi:sulfatase modifying factor 1
MRSNRSKTIAVAFGPFAIAMVVLGSSSACSIRGAGPGDLFSSGSGSSNSDSDDSDGGISAASLQRLNVTCDTPPTPTDTAMVDVPAGDFLMGCNPPIDTNCSLDELPQHTVTLSEFSIDSTEVTAAQYYECVAAGKCLAPTCNYAPCDDTTGNNPVVCVIHADAEAYCAWQQKRLPTEAEWEKAARGTMTFTYPWGDDSLDCGHANYSGCKGEAVAVGSYPEGISPYGALDMAGNVVEYVSDHYDANYYNESPSADPQGPATGDTFVGRGGGFRSVGVWQRTGKRDTYDTVYVKDTLGFRCARSATPASD